MAGDQAVQMVAEEEKRIATENQGSKSQNEAYMTRHKDKGNGKEGKGRDKRAISTCEHCKKRGHTIERCFQLTLELRPSLWVDKGNEDSQSANLAF